MRRGREDNIQECIAGEEVRLRNLFGGNGLGLTFYGQIKHSFLQAIIRYLSEGDDDRFFSAEKSLRMAFDSIGKDSQMRSPSHGAPFG